MKNQIANKEMFVAVFIYWITFSFQFLLPSTIPPIIEFGTPPICHGREFKCDFYDMIDISNVYYNQSRCLVGEYKICQVKPLLKPLKLSRKGELFLTSYNILQVPHLNVHNGQMERTCHIPRVLLNRFPKTDVMVFQEAFSGGCLPKLSFQQIFDYYGFKYSTDLLGKHTSIEKSDSRHFVEPLLLNGGVMIISKWPIVDWQGYIFSNTTDRRGISLTKRGLLWIKIHKQGRSYNVVGVQTEPDNKIVRIAQYEEMAWFLHRLKIPRYEPVILSGDFNLNLIANYREFRVFQSILDVEIFTTTGSTKITYDPVNNDMADSDGKKSFIDFFTYSIYHKHPTVSLQKVDQMKLSNTEEVKFCSATYIPIFHYVSPENMICRNSKRTKYLSDHYLVAAEWTDEVIGQPPVKLAFVQAGDPVFTIDDE